MKRSSQKQTTTKKANNKNRKDSRYTADPYFYCHFLTQKESHNMSSESSVNNSSAPATAETSASKTTFYVSVTGLKLKSFFYLPKFMSYAGPAMKQASAAEGNISASGNYVNGVHHTMSVWKDRKSMTRFMVSGAHAKAMKATNAFAAPGETKVYGYETDKVPTWDEAIAIWKEHGKCHGAKKVDSRSKKNNSYRTKNSNNNNQMMTSKKSAESTQTEKESMVRTTQSNHQTIPLPWITFVSLVCIVTAIALSLE